MELVSERMGSDDMLYKVLRADIGRIEKTIDMVSDEMFSGAVKALVNARTVYVAGVRSAAGLASFAAFYFNVLFNRVKRVSNSMTEDVVEQMLHAGENDVVLGISFPRYSKRTLKAMNFARDRGADVVAITDSANSPLCKYASYKLTARSGMVSFADSITAPLSLINALIAAISLRKKEDIAEAFSNLEQIWDEYDVYEKLDNE